MLFSSIQVKEQFKYCIVHFIGTAVGLIYFVDDNDRLQIQLQCFLQYKTGLWHWSFKSIYEQQHTICHFNHPLYFTAKVSCDQGYLSH